MVPAGWRGDQQRESEISGRYLSLAGREEIAILHAWGHGRAEIARRLKRHRSTIGRELDRNTTGRDGYRASTAQVAAEQRAKRYCSATREAGDRRTAVAPAGSSACSSCCCSRA
ncbi:helix-turn-helix domain-containing protein [Saccharopolyspora erythraea]|uniref:Transposase IS30-like HTH domain-containing protein n=1 Tax=Saccharopolyspora erythraea TaxID=1836 RepID=A0ABN1E509_SACER|nr:helix-turn-helix domain-containing protein [Saccharopolyspora erythraea]